MTTAMAATDTTTRERILRAAEEVFAQSGFHNATVREICGNADVNVASVNYYFGSKEKLYEAVCRRACGDHSRFCLPDEADPRERLRAYIGCFLTNILRPDRTSHSDMILTREVNEPSPVLTVIIDDLFKSRFQQLYVIVRDLLGDAADDTTARRCCLSIIGQCLHYRHARHIITRLNPFQKYDSRGIAEIIDHVTEFSLGALETIKRRQGT